MIRAIPDLKVGALADRLGVLPRRLALQAALLIAAAVAFYVLAPELVGIYSAAPAIVGIGWLWLALMVVAQAVSLGALAMLVRAFSPRSVGALDHLLVQLSANAASSSVPGGAATGGAVSIRLLGRSGMTTADAGGALTATSVISTATIAALAPVAGLLALVHAEFPAPLAFAVVFGSIVAVALLVTGWLLLATDWPIDVAAAVARGVGRLLGRFGRSFDVSARDMKRHRRDVRNRLRHRWGRALGMSCANWLLDFASLALALAAVGAGIGIGVALLAFVAAAVLRMIPITPGGLGFVEGGLTSTLTLAGLPALGALVVTLAYRAVSFWLPIPAGGIAYLVHRRRHPLAPNSSRG